MLTRKGGVVELWGERFRLLCRPVLVSTPAAFQRLVWPYRPLVILMSAPYAQ